MGPIRRVLDAHRRYHLRDPQMLVYVGILGTLFYPLFYLLRFTKATPVYDDLLLRLTAAFFSAIMLLRSRWPKKLQPYFYDYSYVLLIFALPGFFVYESLRNDGGAVGVGNTLMAVFFTILVTEWSSALVMLAVGFTGAIVAYILTAPDPTWPAEYVARFPIMVMVLMGGLVFKRALERATATQVRTAYASLAATIAHEMRNPLAQLKHSQEGVQQVLPPPGGSHSVTVSQAELDTLYRHLAHGDVAIRRGLQAISMTLDAIQDKAPDSASFQLLTASEAVRKAVEEFSLGSNDAGRDRVKVHVLDDFQFRGDETAFLFVLFNLLKNALYYVSRYPDMRVDITIGDHEVRVRDTGPGMAPEVLRGLFEPFRTTGKAGGTGLGLAYCRRVMTSFGGTIHCDSELGHFTEFSLHFPAVSTAEQDQHSHQILEAARNALSGKRLLLVEDDPAQRVATRMKLKPVGMVVDEAHDGQQALEMLSASTYDLVLLDLQMPVVDGYQVAQRLRQGQAPANRYVRIVAYTSEPAHLARVKTQRAGMDGFISKPCAQLVLVQCVQRALERPALRAAAQLLLGRRLLLADDSAYNRRAVAAYLRESGAEVVEVEHGEAVLDRLQGDGRFDAVLLDLNMPGMDGLEAARAIRGSRKDWSRLPIIALTAHSDAPAIDAAVGAGMNGYLVKPVDAEILYDTLQRLLAGQPAVPLPVTTPAPVVPSGGQLLNEVRLESYRRLGLLDEILEDCLTDIERLVEDLAAAVHAQDLDGAQKTMHALLGMSGEAGAHALNQYVRAIYVPVREQERWPEGEAWLEQVRSLATQSEQALRAYGATPAGETQA